MSATYVISSKTERAESRVEKYLDKCGIPFSKKEYISSIDGRPEGAVHVAKLGVIEKNTLAKMRDVTIEPVKEETDGFEGTELMYFAPSKDRDILDDFMQEDVPFPQVKASAIGGVPTPIYMKGGFWYCILIAVALCLLVF